MAPSPGPVDHRTDISVLGRFYNCHLGDIGQMFPDIDPALKGADSIELLRRAADAVRATGWHPGNIDLSVVLDRPKLVSVKDDMQRNLSDAAGCPVTITGRRTEGVGAFGRGEGVAAWAVALVHR